MPPPGTIPLNPPVYDCIICFNYFSLLFFIIQNINTTVNLDLPPIEMWAQVITDYKETMKVVLDFIFG